MCGSMNDVLGLGKLEKFSTCWSHAGAHWFSGLSGPEGYWATGAGPNCRRRLPNSACKSASCAASKVYHLREPAHLRASSRRSWQDWKVKHPWDYLELCGLWSVVDEPSLGQRTKKVGASGHVGGGRVCPGRARHRVLRPHLGRVGGVNAVTIHQGHARSASHWQARSTDLKLSQPPRGRGRCVGGQWAARALWAGYPGTTGFPSWCWPGFRTRTPGRDRGLQPDGQEGQTNRQTQQGGKGPPSGKATVCRCRPWVQVQDTRCGAQRTRPAPPRSWCSASPHYHSLLQQASSPGTMGAKVAKVPRCPGALTVYGTMPWMVR